jgi:hypothetical protein
MAKSTNAELSIRYATVAEMLIKGQSREDIVQYASKTWSVSDRTADDYISNAWIKIRTQSDEDIEKNKHLALSRYNDLYKRNFNIQDYRECRQVQNDIVKLLGIAAPDKIDHTSKGESLAPPIQWIKPDGTT